MTTSARPTGLVHNPSVCPVLLHSSLQDLESLICALSCLQHGLHLILLNIRFGYNMSGPQASDPCQSCPPAAHSSNESQNSTYFGVQARDWILLLACLCKTTGRSDRKAFQLTNKLRGLWCLEA